MGKEWLAKPKAVQRIRIIVQENEFLCLMCQTQIAGSEKKNMP